ncbi:MAG: ABC transporter permease subunit [Eubacteriales bacterium]
MNILKMELKSLYKTMLIWTVAIVATFMLFTIGIFPIFEEKTELVMQMMAGMPEEFLDAFGFGMDSFTYFEDFYGFTYFYLAIMGAIAASLMTIRTFGKEKQYKAQDFLFTKPISRTKIFVNKALAVVLVLGGSNLIFIPCSIYCFLENGIEDSAVLASCALLFLELFCVSLGIFLTVFMRKIRSSASIATGIGFLLFAINSVINLLDIEAAKYLSPFQYYDPGTLFEEGSYDMTLVIFSIVVMVMFVGVSFYKYTTNDIESV